MVNYCCVPHCNKTGGFLFPHDKELFKKWQVAVCRVTAQKKIWKPSEHSVVCKEHFEETDFIENNTSGYARERQKLKDGVVPSVFSFKKSANKKSKILRQKRRDRREAKKREAIIAAVQHHQSEPSINTADENIQVFPDEIDFAMEIELSDVKSEEEANDDDDQVVSNPCVGVQVMTPSFGNLRLQQFENDPSAINYYTGFKNVSHLRFFLDCLGPATYHLSYKARELEPEDELLLCLIKLRQNKGLLINIDENET